MRNILFLLIFLVSGELFAQYSQDWKNTYDSDDNVKVNAACETFDNGIILAGFTTNDYGDKYLWLAKLNTWGDMLWEKTFKDYYISEATDIIETENNDLCVVGYSIDKGLINKEMWVLRLNSYGEKKWAKRIGHAEEEGATGVVQTSAGNFMISGYSTSNKNSVYNFWLIKLSPEGNVLTERAYGKDDEDYAKDICKTGDGAFFIVGYTESVAKREKGNKRDIWLKKVDNKGNEVWSKVYGDSPMDVGNAVETDKDGNIVIAGVAKADGIADYDIVIMKAGKSGELQWKKQLGGIDWDEATDLDISYKNNYIISAYTESKRRDFSHFWSIELDKDGNEIWNKIYKRKSVDFANCIKETYDKGFIIAGSTQAGSGSNWDAALIKFSNIFKPDFQFIFPDAQETFSTSQKYKISFYVRTPADLTELKVYLNGRLWNDTLLEKDISFDSVEVKSNTINQKSTPKPYERTNLIMRTVMSEDSTKELEPRNPPDSLITRTVYQAEFTVPLQLEEEQNHVRVKATNKYGIHYSKERIINYIDLPLFQW